MVELVVQSGGRVELDTTRCCFPERRHRSWQPCKMLCFLHTLLSSFQIGTIHTRSRLHYSSSFRLTYCSLSLSVSLFLFFFLSLALSLPPSLPLTITLSLSIYLYVSLFPLFLFLSLSAYSYGLTQFPSHTHAFQQTVFKWTNKQCDCTQKPTL